MSIVAVVGLFFGARVDTRVGMMFLVAVVLLLLFASWRFVRITRRVMKLGFSPASDSATDAFRAIAGVIGYLAIVAAMLVAWGGIGLTASMFFLPAGSASGVGLGIAALAFPPLYAISEVFLYFWLRPDLARPSVRK